MRIAFLLQRSAPDVPLVSAVTAEIVSRLRERGASVDLLIAGDGAQEVSEIRPSHDLYVLKSKTPLTLGLAGVLTVGGAQVVNSVRSCQLARDKIATTALLAGQGVPVPPSWTTGLPALLRQLLEGGPLWLKPQRGSRGAGVRRLADASDLDSDDPCVDPYGLPLPMYAQREVPSSGLDLKVYVAGQRLWAIAKTFPARVAEDKIGMPAFLPPGIRRTALVCGEVMGLELYGVDFLMSADRFFVVDVNAFPGYKGATDAPLHLSDYLYERARRPYAQAGAASVEAV